MVQGGPQGLHVQEDLQTLCIVVCFFFASGFKSRIGVLVLVFPLVGSVMVPQWIPHSHGYGYSMLLAAACSWLPWPLGHVQHAFY